MLSMAIAGPMPDSARTDAAKPMPKDDEILVDRFRGGDASAFERWVAAAEATVRLSLRSFAAVVDTEAVLQEALLRVWQVAPKFCVDGKPDALLRFASVTARNVALSELRL